MEHTSITSPSHSQRDGVASHSLDNGLTASGVEPSTSNRSPKCVFLTFADYIGIDMKVFLKMLKGALPPTIAVAVYVQPSFFSSDGTDK
jgi:hypothetical protein